MLAKQYYNVILNLTCLTNLQETFFVIFYDY